MKLNIDDLGVCGIVVDDWDITKEFKPKTITTDYTSWICYISRRPVPANTPITNTYYWKPICRLSTEITADYNKFKENIEALIASIIHSSESGAAFANEFGDNTDRGINQKVITDAFNKVWQKIEDITGEAHQGFSLSITPPYYIGEHGSDVLITAVPAPEFGYFESIKLYLNGEVIADYGKTDYLQKTTHIDEESIIKCEAKIMGIVYTEQKTIKHYSSFWLGAGADYHSVLNDINLKPIGEDMRSSFDVTVSETGQHIIVIVGADLTGYIRADMNGFEIPMTVSTITVDGKNYKVYTSDNVYAEGTYNIDING